ncbi:MAG: ferrous iron transport protein B [Verrucomicrobiae bacterium]|nr:ferrous iron transport protein B [Verrucomicrobiae bacterium]
MMSRASEGSTPAGKSDHGDRPRVFALVGNPNSGKTTLFNSLTGLRQKVSNYPGVTVERKEGTAIGQHGEPIRIIDLPGAYSLNPQSPDEEIMRDVLLGRRGDLSRPDAVICVIDATNAERHLYLATQVLELGLPTIIVLNMTDLAEANRIQIDPEKLADKLGVPVIPMRAHRRTGLPELRIAMSRHDLPASGHSVPLPEEIHGMLEKVHASDSIHARHAALYAPGKARQLLDDNQAWEDRLIAARYEAIRDLCEDSFRRDDVEVTTLTDRLDSLFLHRFFGWIILSAVLLSLFLMIFYGGELPMQGIEWLFGKAGEVVQATLPPGDFRDLVTDGIIAGVGGVIVFLPQILILFFFIGLMEDSGYLPRVAFLLDRFMSRVGLHGRSFIPLLSAYACAIPGIMGTRTIENPKDRLVTILVTPFASCSARLPVYAIMIVTIFPTERVPTLAKAGLLFGMYALGTLGIFIFAWIFNKVLKRNVTAPSVMELPTYKMPSLTSVLAQMWERSRLFVRRAGTVILGISILLWAANTYPKSTDPDPAVQAENSFAGRIGHAIEPVIEPLGYDWRIGVGIVASFAAREVFVSAMRISFNVAEDDEDDAKSMGELRQKFRETTRDDGSPLFSPLTCLSLMVFYVFALQCASTVAVVRRETNSWRWPIFQFTYMTLTAYFAAMMVYQGGKLLGYT